MLTQKTSTNKKVQCLIYGDQCTGKTQLLEGIFNNRYNSNTGLTIGIAHHSKQIKIRKEEVEFIIWELAGLEIYLNIARIYFESNFIQFMILIYDITNRESFENIMNRLFQIQKNARRIPIIAIVGNKLDREEYRTVLFQEGQELSKQLGAQFFEVSAKKNYNIDKLEDFLINDVIEKGTTY
ncbi:hypothetical protein ABPG74_013153 [Tetrahymena malaccensis]